jgi:signal transduction histidine kinase
VEQDQLDYQLLFEQSPDILLILRADPPRYTMIAANDARLLATNTTRETLGKGLFEVFPDNPDDPAATGMNNLRTSLDRVVRTRAPDTMAVQKYDIRSKDGSFEVRYWSPKNLPVVSPAGDILYIIHRVEDVTELVQASALGDELRGRTKEMEREVLLRSQELSEANRELRAANEKLGKLDAAKTAFFSNVSHEFRTPLTLMLGPLEDALSDPDVVGKQRERIQLAHDNALRLLRLVSALLDFSRLEAGRLTAAYAPLDLGRLTAELAGMFQSAVNKMGVRLVIDCPTTSEPAWVDRDMWEKIVPNLLSNALKFTIEGEICVRLREVSGAFVLEVSDTGVGIPSEAIPHIFERFYRAPGERSRTHEGTGIGLSLVHQLVLLHGGVVRVESEEGKGTTFLVEIPKGYAHLPAESVSKDVASTKLSRHVSAHAVEVKRWLEERPSLVNGNEPSHPPPSSTDGLRPRILVVDDNADLRRYIADLLAPAYEVRTAVDGVSALEEIKKEVPELVVSDVMMPRLDGFGLLRALRSRPETALLPVILLSARAGEESAVEGLDAGSDDYLIKPFSARELLARVGTHVKLARSRRQWIEELSRANRELDAFSYSVSHDLRAPLRAIDGFSRALSRDIGGVVDESAQHYLERIEKSVGRMGELIDALLELARISRLPLMRKSLDLAQMAREVLDDLRTQQPKRQVEVRVGADLKATGDERLLRVVLVNLLGNAFKFTSHTDPAVIEIGTMLPSFLPLSEVTPRDLSPNETVYFVRDNGAGFDMAYATRLFAPFQRLHGQKEFEGTGVGLATVRRVISRHHGKLWAHASLGQGATFFFTLAPLSEMKL